MSVSNEYSVPLVTGGCDAAGWPRRRQEILSLFSDHVYGCTPDIEFDRVEDSVLETLELACGTLRESHIIFFERGGSACWLRYVIYLPAGRRQAMPCVAMIEPFDTNPEVAHSAALGYEHLPYREINALGMAAVWIAVDDLCPDDADQCVRQGLLCFAPRTGPESWGAVGVWAWAASRVIDRLTADERFDAGRIALAGCSRAGKTALWCAAQDERVALVISNVSGCTGAAMARGKQGERIADITRRFPHWTCPRYAEYAEREEELPVDQHLLLALCAPRPLYVSSASEDDWAHPAKEFESCVRAGEAYRLLGAQGLCSETSPPVDTPLTAGTIAYHLRTGAHGCRLYDWQQYLPFICRSFGLDQPAEEQA